MSNKFRESRKAHKENFAEVMMHSPVPSNDPLQFQIFFLSQDQSESVEIVETDEIDFEEILQRLKMGESVFIKNKEKEIFEPHSRTNEEENKPWYFNHV